MNRFRFLFLILTFCTCGNITARVVNDTLFSSQNDRVILSYELKQNDEKVELRFTNIRIRLGDMLFDKYRKTSEIVAVFFDRVGDIKDIRFTGLTPKALSVSSGLGYSPSPDGYFLFDPYQYPSLVFDKKTAGEALMSIPVYIAHYEKKRHYEILCACGSLEVKLGTTPTQMPPAVTENAAPPQYEPIEIEPEMSEEEDWALNMVNSIMSRLPEQTEAPIDATLEQEVKNLIDLKSKIKNEAVQERIKEAVDAFEAKKKELTEAQKAKEDQQMAIKADNEAFNQCLSIEACELYLNSYPDGIHVEEVRAKKAELEASAKEKEDKEKRRKIWMIVGGTLLAILLFVGNQVMQTIRNKRTQRSMMQMQQDAVNRAKSMAKGKTQGAIRKQTDKARRAGQNAVRDAVDGVTKPKGKGNNNRISI